MSTGHARVGLQSRHARFLLACLIGLAGGLGALALPLPPETRFLVAVDLACAVYLALMLHFAAITGAEALARQAAQADEGAGLMLAIGVGIVGLGLVAIFRLLSEPGTTGLATGLLALAAVPLGWATLQVMAAFHYARLYYRAGPGGDGLTFPGGAPPGAHDFLYFAFGVGMTAQVADIAVTTTPLRRTVLVHATASFFFNTVILALAVNAAVSIGQG